VGKTLDSTTIDASSGGTTKELNDSSIEVVMDLDISYGSGISSISMAPSDNSSETFPPIVDNNIFSDDEDEEYLYSELANKNREGRETYLMMLAEEETDNRN
jgi:hypothetical protein